MAPRPRFEKLDVEKRRSILQVAAEEFASHGFDGASFNRIIERAGISKGAAYYYFDDKIDLFETVLQAGIENFEWFLKDSDVAQNPDEFWKIVEAHTVRGLRLLQEHAWFSRFMQVLVGVFTAGPNHSKVVRAFKEVADWKTRRFLEHGQSKGAIRTDLPTDLLVKCLFSMSLTVDQWFLDSTASMSEEDIEQWAATLTDLMRRMLQPAPEGT